MMVKKQTHHPGGQDLQNVQVFGVRKHQEAERTTAFAVCSREIECHWQNNSSSFPMGSTVGHGFQEKGGYQERTWGTESKLRHGCAQPGMVNAARHRYRFRDANLLERCCRQVGDRKVNREKGGALRGRRYRCRCQKLLLCTVVAYGSKV